ncbi:hypothetical protein Tco_0818551 [Tanacetum coccineum]
MTGNKAYLADYQDINGGPVAFGGSRGYITGRESNQDSGTKDKMIQEFSNRSEMIKTALNLPIWHSFSSTNKSSSKSDGKRGSLREEEQIFLDDLARLQIQD